MTKTTGKESDIVIIGGGIIGLFCAYYLIMAGKTVTVLERDKIGSGASHGNCGLLVFSDILPLCSPGAIRSELIRLIKRTSPLSIGLGINIPLWKFLYGFWASCNEKHLTHAMGVRSEMLDLSQGLFEDYFRDNNFCDWKHEGIFIICKEEYGLKHYAKTNELLKPFGLDAKLLGKQELLEMEPAVSNNVAGGYYHSVDYHLRPDLLIDSLKDYLKKLGVEFEENCTVTGFFGAGKKITAVDTEKGKFKADKFVLAAGAWSVLLLKHLGLSIPVEPGKGYSITMERPSICPKVPCYMHERNVVATPFKTGYRLGGAMEFTGFNLSLNQKRLEKIKQAAKYYMKEPFGEPVIEEWTSLRPMCVDDLPIISWLPERENTVIATGHGMMGITMSTGTGKLVADMICEQKTEISIEPFSIKRFISHK